MTMFHDDDGNDDDDTDDKNKRNVHTPKSEWNSVLKAFRGDKRGFCDMRAHFCLV